MEQKPRTYDEMNVMQKEGLLTPRREIKFRVWDKQRRNMSDSRVSLGDQHLSFSDYDVPLFRTELDRFDFMQFTGISRKNGEEHWYEGDILENDTDWYKIVYDETEARFEAIHLYDGDNLSLGELNVRDTQKMGNIYESPSLLSTNSEK